MDILPTMADLTKRKYPSETIVAVFQEYGNSGAVIRAKVCMDILDKGELHPNELLKIREVCEKAGVRHLKMTGFFHPGESQEALEYFKIMAHAGILAGHYK
jgi:hypothetical protein